VHVVPFVDGAEDALAGGARHLKRHLPVKGVQDVLEVAAVERDPPCVPSISASISPVLSPIRRHALTVSRPGMLFDGCICSLIILLPSRAKMAAIRACAELVHVHDAASVVLPGMSWL
jgi:hypothetical protein